MIEYFIFLAYSVNFLDTWKISDKRFSWDALGEMSSTFLNSVSSL